MKKAKQNEPFRIKKSNYRTAYDYLNKKLEEGGKYKHGSLRSEIKDHGIADDPVLNFRLCLYDGFSDDKHEKVEALHQWCERYLLPKHWKRMRDAIRQHDKRQKSKKSSIVEKKHSVDLKSKGYHALKRLSEAFGKLGKPLDLSETISVCEDKLYEAGVLKSDWDI
ncbi:hypothetical protein H0A36_26880 [Endozoicomonas sp. SM1973]|uniref:Uncharacterized protein n=1 Tax=Spartinivicinus marinus TaxID=2994442 RepID=A0A853IHY8_9GAMM|nr:hypothetical protein [Spartinivicinus marinus]MCX4030297.1 hypothetical protein [Spartinivicinus marinus]NYZ69644.1 hypothetical protein [Spartinivicinus marinus]